MTVQCLIAAVLVSVSLPLGSATRARAQAPEAPAQAPRAPTESPVGSKLWIVGGGGFSMARAGCAECSRDGVFTNGRGLFFDVGGRVSPRVDFGVEAMFVSGRIEGEPDPIRTTFILGIAQFRPWIDRGLYLRAGMGVAFAGNGIYSPWGPELKPPYSTNGLGLTYGLGWIFGRHRRWTVQAAFSHHIAALGALSTETENEEAMKNVVGNHWTSGIAIAIRPGHRR